MLVKRILIILLLMAMISGAAAGTEKPVRYKKVLILFSLVPSTPVYHIFQDGIRQKLSDEFGEGFDLHMEYLETEKFPKGEYPKNRFGLYNKKYENVKLDLLVCVGPDIVSTIRQHASQKLLSLPVLSIDYDLSSFGYPSETSLNDQTAVIAIRPDPAGTISEALALFPDTRYIHVVSGVSSTDKVFLSITQQAAGKISGGRTFIYHTDISMDDALRIVSRLPEKSIIVIPYFNEDNNRVAYYNPEAIRLISKAGNAPVFAYSNIGLGDGSVGGYIFSFDKIGLKAGETVVKILKGSDPASIKISEHDYFGYMFDWRQLKRWNIDDSDRIPKGSTILYKETTFFEKYRFYFFMAIAFLLLETFLIVALVLTVRKQKRTTRKLIETENKFRTLVREDRILRIGQMTATLAHELNQPLTAILSTAQAGLRFIDSGNQDPGLIKEILQNIVEDDKRTAALLASIRGMIKLEKREKEKVNLNSLVDELMIVYQGEIIRQKTKVNKKLAGETVFVMADRIQIQQVIMNFIFNALHSLEKINRENKMITITETVKNDDVILSVRDNGIGIDVSIKASLFKPFRTTKKDGLGIGLAISRSIIDDHHGKIWAENIPDGGAEFSFSLKIHRDDA